MITSLFRKSTPLNYTVMVLTVVIFFVLYHVSSAPLGTSVEGIFETIAIGLTLFGSLFIVNFIVKKNGLSKDSSYTILVYFLLHLFIPHVFENINLMLSNFFVLLAFRRLISLQSLKFAKEKVFDASLWVFVAALFHFWSILFIVMVFISIIVHVARDYRNWLLPFIALFAVSTSFLLFALLFNEQRIDYLFNSATINLKIDYFSNVYENLAISLYVPVVLFFLASLALTLSNRPLVLHTSYKKIMTLFFIAVVIFVISSGKSNDLLIFTVAPVAMMATSHLELKHPQWQKEVILGLLIVCSFFTFFSQL